ncbi:MAG: hypothetical protein JKY65_00720 [Planctomycetes bacterium]|nr:hypothetical protein [Planctomycetota bacterium]
MKILRLAHARVLLWAHDQGGGEPFEVSKVVDGPLQARCETAPRCPGEDPDAESESGESGLWVDPQELPVGDCAYAFPHRGACLSHRNQLALERAMFLPTEVALTRRLLESLGYRVREESIDATHDAPRILIAHGNVQARSHQVKLIKSPSAGSVVMVRRVGSQQRRSSHSQLRVLAGGNL